MRMTRIVPTLLALGFALSGCNAMGVPDDSYHPQINPADFQSSVDNPYFPLPHGMKTKFVEKKGSEQSINQVEVLPGVKKIMGVNCVIVHDTITEDGALKEDTYDWYAQDKRGNVWYFGEETKEFKPSGESSSAGSWEAGVGGAQPGIIMPAELTTGAEPYRQEYLAGHAEDMGQIAALNESVSVPLGSFKGCVKTREWSMLESGDEKKWYCRGVGFVKEVASAGEVVTLESMTKP